MEELIKGMLCIRSHFAPNNRTGIQLNFFTITLNRLTVRFHFQLLQIRSKVFQSSIIRQDGMSLNIQKIVIPCPQQSHQHRNIALKRLILKMLIDRISTSQQLLKTFNADTQGNWQSDTGPKRITSSDPIPQQ